MSPKLRTILAVLLVLALCGSGAVVIRRTLQYREGEAEYAEAEALAELPDLSDLEPALLPEPKPEAAAEPEPEPEPEAPGYVDPYADALAAMDFAALREVNPDVVGWILIPGTAVSYPLVQGEDNDYYLDHTWKKWSNVVGSIFLECRNSPSLADFNTIIYGHRMNNGSMFASLKYYKQQSYWAQHPVVYITDDAGAHRYEIFAAYEISTAGDTYRLDFSSDQDKQDFLDYCLEQSAIDTGLTPTIYDRILTLSTCTGSGHATRWVVQAMLRGEAPPAAEDAETEQAQAAPEEEAGNGGTDQPSRETEQALPDQTAGEEALTEEQAAAAQSAGQSVQVPPAAPAGQSGGTQPALETETK